MAAKKKAQAVYNRTSLTAEQIDSLPVIGETVSNWRQRNIVLRQHPTDENRLISVGTTFDKSMVVIADESRKDWQTALDYIGMGQIYVSQ